jgi:hypothetical protein
MLTAYVAQASLVTFYLLALLTIRFNRPAAFQNTPWIFRIMQATQHSTSNFLNASFLFSVGTEKRREKVVVLRELHRAIIYTRELSKQAIADHVSTAFTVYSVNEGARLTFSIAMLLASMIQFSQLLRGTAAMTYTAATVSMLMTFNSLLPVVVLQLAASNILRRLHGRAVLWAFVAITTSTVLGLSFKTSYSLYARPMFQPGKYSYRIDAQLLWERMCYDSTANDYLIIFAWSAGWAITLSIDGYVLTFVAMRIWHRSKSLSWLTRLSRILWWTGPVLAWCTMWSFIGWFI